MGIGSGRVVLREGEKTRPGGRSDGEEPWEAGGGGGKGHALGRD